MTAECEDCGGPATVITDPGAFDATMDRGECVIVKHPIVHQTGCAKGAELVATDDDGS